MYRSILLTVLLSGTALAAEPTPAAAPPATPSRDGRPLPKPAPLPAKPFKLPTTESFTLKNGLKVLVARNDEVPLWDVRLAFNVGGYADPTGKEGLASVTLDMLNEGAGGLSSEDISRKLKLMGSSIGASADDDGAVVAASGLVRNLEPTLDLFAKVVMSPDFPSDEWSVLQKRRIADLAAQKEDPTAIATRVARHVTWGDDYRGRLGSEQAFKAISPADMKTFWTENYGPKDAILLVGGAVDPKVIVPLLDAKLGGWTPNVTARPKPKPKVVKNATPVLYLVDKPGAAQSVIRVGKDVGDRLSPDFYALSAATEALGTFTGRVNMNLRENKGYTYGAYCTARYAYGPGLWSCSTSVRTDATAASVDEIRKELTMVLGDKPITAEEVAYRKSSDSLAFPGQFELTGSILGEKAEIWRYDLPADWTERYVPGIQKVDVAATNAALKNSIKLEDLVWVVVGDSAVVRPDLEKLGLPIVVLDRDGNPQKGN